MDKYTRLTETGLNKITEARSRGAYLEILYYLPVYDITADTTLINIPDFDIDDYTNLNDEVPSGEQFWNIPDWGSQYYNDAPADNDYLIELSAVGTGGTYTSYLNGKSVRPTVMIPSSNPTVLTTVGFSYIYDEDSRVSTPEETGTTEWVFNNVPTMKTSVVLSDASIVPSDITAPAGTNLYDGTKYTRNLDDENTIGGLFYAYVSIPNGTLKFNKVGWYAVMRDETGIIDTNPFLFAQSYEPEPITIYGNNGGSSSALSEPKGSIVLFELDAINSVYPLYDIMYSNSDEYWTRVTDTSGRYGLHYTGQVYIANTLGFETTSNKILPRAEDVGVAKQLITTYFQVNKQDIEEERELPQLALQNVDYPVPNNLYSIIRRTTFRVTADGDLEFDMYGGCREDDNSFFMPKNDTSISLGNETNRWGRLYLSDRLELANGDYDDILGTTQGTNEYDQFYIRMGLNDMLYNDATDTYLAETGFAFFNNTQVRVGPHYNADDVGGATLRPNHYYTYGNISNDLYLVRNDAGDKTLIEHILGVRSTQDIFMYTMPSDYINHLELGDGVTTNDNEWANPTGSSNKIESLIYYGARARDKYTSDGNLSDDYKMTLDVIAGMRSPSSLALYTDGTDNPYMTIYDNLFDNKNRTMLARYNNVLGDPRWYGDESRSIVSEKDKYGITDTDYADFIDKVNPIIDSSGLRDSILQVGYGKSINLMSSGEIWTFGDIKPMVDGIWDLGTEGYGFRKLYVNTIVGTNGNLSRSSENYITIDGNVYPSKSGQTIGRVPTTLENEFGNERPRWGTINAKYIGLDDDRIYAGFFNTVTAGSIISTDIAVGNNRINITDAGIRGTIDYIGSSKKNPIENGFFTNLWVTNIQYTKLVEKKCENAQ